MPSRFVVRGKFVLDRKTKKQYPILHYRAKSVLYYPFSLTMPHVVHKDDRGRLYFLTK